MKTTFTVVFEKADDGYTVTIPALPGLVTSGHTLEEARKMVLEAIHCHLESLRKDGDPIPVEHEMNVETLEVELSEA